MTLPDVVDQILLEIEELDEKPVVLADLCGADAYHLQHAIDVTALGLLIGRRLIIEHGWLDYKGERQDDRHEERLFRLGMGLLLSDIGKLAIPEAILNSPGKLSEDEWEIVKTHPKAGVKLVRDTGAWCPLVQACVLRHHERWDGAGYPEGKGATEIHEMARIAAVADVYDAITSERVFAPARPAHVGVQAIIAGAGTQFDPTITDVFSRRIAPFPPGVEVELTDGRRAVVVSVSELAIDRPVVRVISGPGGAGRHIADRGSNHSDRRLEPTSRSRRRPGRAGRIVRAGARAARRAVHARLVDIPIQASRAGCGPAPRSARLVKGFSVRRPETPAQGH